MRNKIIEWRPAIVISILSGDHICVKYSNGNKSIEIIKLAYCRCPNLNFFFENTIEEPHSIQSWIFLHSILKMKRVLVSFPSIQSNQNKISIPILGELPYSIREIKIYQNEEDILTNLLTEGWASINEFESDEIFSIYGPIQKAAKQRSCNIWSSFIPSLSTSSTNLENLLEFGEFDAFILDFTSDCNLKLFIPTEMIKFELEVAGIYFSNFIKKKLNKLNIFLV